MGNQGNDSNSSPMGDQEWMNSMSTAVADPNSKPKQLTIRDRLKSPAMIAELGKALPKHCKPDRMARVALTALTRTPRLAECDEASFFKCLLDLSQWGLEPDGRRAHLIPFRNNKKGITECQLIIDYKGYVELAYRSGIVKSIHADVVRRGDVFEYNMGHVTKHVPHFLRVDPQKPDKPGDVFAVYCVVELTGGTVKTEVLSKDEVEAIRKRSRSGNDGPWVTDWNEMGKKSAFRRASKWLPLSAEIIDAFERDDDKLIEGTVVQQQERSFDDVTALLSGGESSDQVVDGTATETTIDLNAAFQLYQNDLEATTTDADARACYDRYFSPDSQYDFAPDMHTLAVRLRHEHSEKLSKKK